MWNFYEIADRPAPRVEILSSHIQNKVTFARSLVGWGKTIPLLPSPLAAPPATNEYEFQSWTTAAAQTGIRISRLRDICIESAMWSEDINCQCQPPPFPVSIRLVQGICINWSDTSLHITSKKPLNTLDVRVKTFSRGSCSVCLSVCRPSRQTRLTTDFIF